MRGVLIYTQRAVPWWRVLTAAGLVIVLVELVRWSPWTLWPLEGTAVGLLAGATAWCFDEEAAAVVDVAPRGLAWRTAARLSGGATLAAVWVAVIAHSRSAMFGHEWAVLIQGLVAIVVGLAWATWRRSNGEATPGLVAATVAVPIATSWALVRPLERRLPVFPYGFDGPYETWNASSAGWAIAGVVALVLLGYTLAKGR